MTEIVSLTIGGEQFRFWSEVTLDIAIDNHPTVGFVAPFEAERADFRKLFRPFSYAPVELFVGEAKVFTGTMIDVVPTVSAAERIVQVTAYSKAAKLSECDMPWRSLPLQCDNLKLNEIAKHFCDPFELGVVIDGDPGPAFSRVKPTKRTKKRNKVFGGQGQETLEVEGNIQEFLAELGRQRGYVLASNEDGDVWFRRSRGAGKPVARFEEGVQPALSVTPQFNPREWYSEITGITPAKNKRKGSAWTEQNPFLTGELRSMSFNLDDTEAADARVAVRAKMARMFANAMSVVVMVPTWRDKNGRLWAPDATVTLLAPNAMIYTESDFLIRNVTFGQSAGQESAELTLVLPGAFSGELPDGLPWLE